MAEKQICIGNYNDAYVNYFPQRGNSEHVLITGVTGSGKSVFAQRLMLEMAKTGATILAIDLHNVLAPEQIYPVIKDEFCALMREVDVYKDGLSIPLFTPIRFRDGSSEDPFDTSSAVADCLSRSYRFGDRQRATLRSVCQTIAMAGSYASNGFAELGFVLDSMKTKTASILSDRLSPLIYHNVFRDGEFFVEKGMINIIRLSKFDSNTQSTISDVILSYIWRLALVQNYSETGLSVFIDEAQNIGYGKDKAISKILTEGRKFNVNLTLSTQFLPTSPNIRKVLLQSSLEACFKPHDEALAEITNIIDPTDTGEIRYILRSLKRGEFIIAGDFGTTGSIEVDGIAIKSPIKVFNNLDNCQSH